MFLVFAQNWRYDIAWLKIFDYASFQSTSLFGTICKCTQILEYLLYSPPHLLSFPSSVLYGIMGIKVYICTHDLCSMGVFGSCPEHATAHHAYSLPCVCFAAELVATCSVPLSWRLQRSAFAGHSSPKAWRSFCLRNMRCGLNSGVARSGQEPNRACT